MNFLIQLVVGFVLSFAGTLLKQAFAPKQKSATGTRGTAEVGGKVAQYFLMGTVGEAGKLEYTNFWGHSGDVPNAYNVDVYSFGDLPITALSKLYVFGAEEPISSSGHVTQGYPTTGDKAGKLWIEFFDGTQTTANSYLLGKFGSDADRPWLSDMIFRGVPYLTATALWDEKVWTRFPEIVGEFQGIKLYDVTKDSTAGGSGSQRWDNPSTWAFSDNNAVMVYNILRGIYYNGARVWGGSCTAAQLPYDVWAAAIAACDAPVALLGGGTEKAFRAGRRVNLNERPSEVIQELLIGCNGRISHAADGQVYILVGVPSEADAGFTDDDVLATEPLGSIPFPNLDSIVNGATATYREPSQAWEDKETAPYIRSDLVAEDDGREQTQGLDLGTTFSGTQAQRILKAVIEEGRRFRTHVVALPPEFAHYRPLHVVAWTSSRFDYDAKLFLITARTRDPWGNVVFGLQEIDPADHAWTPAVDERPLSFAPVVIARPAPQPMTGWSVAPAYMPDNEGLPRSPSIEVSFAAGLVDVRGVRVQVRLVGASAPVFDGSLPYDPIDTEPSALLQARWPGETAYEVRGKYLPHSGRRTLWSNQDEDETEGPWFAVTTPPEIPVELPPIAPENLGPELAAGFGLMAGSGPGSLADLFASWEDQLDHIAGAVATANMTANVIRESLIARFGEATAAIFEEQQVRATEISALASQVTQVVASLPNILAGGYLRMEAEVDEGASTSTIMFKAFAELDGTLSQAAAMLRAGVVEGGEVKAEFAVNGNFYVLNPVDGEWIAALGVEGGKVKFKGALTEKLSSPNEVNYLDLSDNPALHLESTGP